MMKQFLMAAVLLLSLFLGVRNGCVALLRTDSQDAVAVYPVKIYMLPRQDQLALTQGIPIHSKDQLNHLLEDYLS